MTVSSNRLLKNYLRCHRCGKSRSKKLIYSTQTALFRQLLPCTGCLVYVFQQPVNSKNDGGARVDQRGASRW